MWLDHPKRLNYEPAINGRAPGRTAINLKAMDRAHQSHPSTGSHQFKCFKPLIQLKYGLIIHFSHLRHYAEIPSMPNVLATQSLEVSLGILTRTAGKSGVCYNGSTGTALLVKPNGRVDEEEQGNANKVLPGGGLYDPGERVPHEREELKAESKGFWSTCSSLYSKEEEEYKGGGCGAYPGHRGGYEEKQSVQPQQMVQPHLHLHAQQFIPVQPMTISIGGLHASADSRISYASSLRPLVLAVR
ncbi:hypothetical protein B0H14DRAFT_3693932 [Mycena olivaceomarginata]|nr:hypothetical protein B0H14DRAFT_3693932 [Mycena olivaceomarginata]